MRPRFPQDKCLHVDLLLEKRCSPEKLASELEDVLGRRTGRRVSQRERR